MITFSFSILVFGPVQVLIFSKATKLWGFVSIKKGETVEDGCCSLQDNVFDEANCVFCFVV